MTRKLPKRMGARGREKPEVANPEPARYRTARAQGYFTIAHRVIAGHVVVFAAGDCVAVFNSRSLAAEYFKAVARAIEESPDDP
jgi:hypothetical protein